MQVDWKKRCGGGQRQRIAQYKLCPPIECGTGYYFWLLIEFYGAPV